MLDSIWGDRSCEGSFDIKQDLRTVFGAAVIVLLQAEEELNNRG